MTIRHTVVEQTEINRSGVLQVKIAFILIENGKETEPRWHRTAIPIDVDPIKQMAEVNAHLAIMEPPMPQVSQADIDFVVQCHALLKQRMEQS